jgi:hypothetical protein
MCSIVKETLEDVNLTLVEAKERRGEESRDAVEDEVCEQNPHVPPSGTVVDVEGLVVLVTDSILAILTVAGGVLVNKVTTKSADKLSSPILACLPRGRVEVRKLVIGTDNLKFTVKYVRM